MGIIVAGLMTSSGRSTPEGGKGGGEGRREWMRKEEERRERERKGWGVTSPSRQLFGSNRKYNKDGD